MFTISTRLMLIVRVLRRTKLKMISKQFCHPGSTLIVKLVKKLIFFYRNTKKKQFIFIDSEKEKKSLDPFLAGSIKVA